MLTGKKIGALVFGVLTIFTLLFFSYIPTSLLAAETYRDWGNVKDSQIILGEAGSTVSSEKIKSIYANNTGTRQDVGSNAYAISDGKIIVLFDKNTDSMLGVINDQKGTFREFITPIPASNLQAREDAMNKAARDGGNNYDAAKSIYLADDNIESIKAKNKQMEGILSEIEALEKERALMLEDKQDTTGIDAQIAKNKSLIYEIGGANTKASATLRQINNKKIADAGGGTPEEIYCIRWDTPMFSFPGCAAIVSNWILSLAAFVLWTCALLFDYTLTVTLNFKDLITSLGVIEVGWKIFRDISNIFFIFLLLTAAIGTIIGSGKFNAKSMIPSILIAATLINFSLFFTKVIVDASNIMALQFYSHMGGKTSEGISPLNSDNAKATGIAAIFLDSMNIKSLYTISTSGTNSGATTAAGAGPSLTAANIALVGIGGTILFLVTSFVMLAAIFLFIVRTLTIIVLMTTAPLAFMAYAIPSGPLKDLNSKWWKSLWSQALFAPAYMAMMYVAVMAVKNLGKSTGAGSLVDIFNGNNTAINVVFTFIMIIGFMVIALISAQSFGASGAGAVMKTGKTMRGYGLTALKASTVGVAGMGARTVIGGTAARIADSNYLRGKVSNNSLFGKIAAKRFGQLADVKYGTGKSYNDKTKERMKEDEKWHDYAGGSAVVARKGLFERKKSYEKRLTEAATNKSEATDRKKNYVASVESANFLTPSAVRGSKMFLDKKSSETKSAGEIAEKLKKLKETHKENIAKLSGFKVELVDDAKESIAAIEEVEKNFDTEIEKLLKGDKTSTIKADSDIGKIAEAIEAKKRELNGAPGAMNEGRRETIKIELNQLMQRQNIAITKVSTSIERLRQGLEKEENGTEKELKNLTKILSSDKDKK